MIRKVVKLARPLIPQVRKDVEFSSSRASTTKRSLDKSGFKGLD
ncbi:hypothetical protein ACFSQ3_04925 [Sphingobacterium corticis]|uniref:Uncharacterized protein n=1 Tax=Sphingobacterium corticis TaxID=1812823 RepID=A0ABW5NH43_9SPHI